MRVYRFLGLMWAFLSTVMSAQASTTPFICGVDVSFLPQIETAGGIFYDAQGTPTDALTLLHAQGVNSVRLRIWHTPADGIHDLASTLAMAKRIYALDMGFLLDFHYSDTWADPSHQTKPLAWQSLPFDQLTIALYSYTQSVVSALSAQGTPPNMVQIGNEITSGMLWDDGRVQGERHWKQLIALLQAGVEGVRDGIDTAPMPQIMIHIDAGANQAVSQWFFDHLVADVDFDIIGLSYYPWWQGTLDALKANLDFIAQRYPQDIILVETAYPWTLQWTDNTHNPVGEAKQLAEGYPATSQGQHDFLVTIRKMLQAIPNGKGKGFFYWEPIAISTQIFESSWENLAWFDFKGHILPDLDLMTVCTA